MAQQHRVGDRAEERRAGNGAQQRHDQVRGVVVGGIDRRRRSGRSAPIAGAIRSSAGGNSRPRRVGRPSSSASSRSMPVISATRARAPVVLGVGARDTRPGAWTIDATRAPRRRRDDQRRADLADRHDAERQAARQRTGGHQQVGATQQPAVAEADLATPRGEPEEEQTSRCPLQQNRGRVETNHCRKANDVPMKQEPDGIDSGGSDQDHDVTTDRQLTISVFIFST